MCVLCQSLNRFVCNDDTNDYDLFIFVLIWYLIKHQYRHESKHNQKLSNGF